MTDDRLLAMLAAQERLQREAYHRDITNLSQSARVAFIKNMVLAATDELHEALNEVSWKPWASGDPTINDDAFFAELVDLWHFVMNLLLVAHPGWTPAQVATELSARYQLKNRKNLQRQRDGYDGTNKCPNCRRALDDDAVMCRRYTADEYADGPAEFVCQPSGVCYYADGRRVSTNTCPPLSARPG